MRKPLAAAIVAWAVAGAATTPAAAAMAAEPTLKTVSLAGTVQLSNCSGSIIRFPDSLDTDPALVLSNGHCSSLLDPGVVITDRSANRPFGLLDSSGAQVATLKAEKLSYGTMTDTDVAIYQTTTTYAAIKSSYGVTALTLRDTQPTAGTAVTVASSAWKKLLDCNIDGFVHRLKEGKWTWKDSVRYTSACQTVGGTSGSPVIDQSTGEVVAVHNTGNENGASCTLNNPCEVDPRGNVTVRKGINYGQQTYQIPACFTTGNQLDLNSAGCTLPKP
ncbi:serine protease [Streptomyces scabiei]|uniref:S1 family peptidase n=1 Tax=Streptomyces TaxID=1883 RepID=UPI0003149F80|nr:MULTISPECIES: serine protease [Streptomyces]MBP5866041.1 trypsin-like peptidase domain-containing protein [Streptomyces sp. LBUM 1484]MBP5934139.1 trypsin-like peptidase domain-containing protein [Streptomyces sp. LBUM 1479]MBP5873207.1 trypsin-like peptidase domain-containing protein [Streptomyces sp. LBUM 1477]MBP5880888.1 trypsin-like peptidase domain-containing protein [Streptomyces sp. LBUM 1487]MBP5896641.1 trypsin-like peptidase domain-containing protein [Streptomyces sp. LBUM 1488]